jgi:adenine phosphoribosyltransferase
MVKSDTQVDVEALKRYVRDIPDFPNPGILFRDITPLLGEPSTFRMAVDAMAAPFGGVTKVVAIESRGFILGAPVAYTLQAGLVPVRKVGRLPFDTIREDYSLEYGVNAVEVHSDAIASGERVLIVDDLLATGGTVRAAANLVERLGAKVAGISVLAELADLKGRLLLAEYDVRSLIAY